jgi:hypothetical protein
MDVYSTELGIRLSFGKTSESPPGYPTVASSRSLRRSSQTSFYLTTKVCRVTLRRGVDGVGCSVLRQGDEGTGRCNGVMTVYRYSVA